MIMIKKLPGSESLSSAPTTVAAKARLVKAKVRLAKVVVNLASSAANSKAARSTRNKPTAMHTTGSCKKRAQPKALAKKSALRRLT